MKVIKFEQPNCVPCKLVSEFLDGKVEYEKISAFDDPDKAADFGVMSVPVVVVLDDNGTEIARTTGYKENELNNIVAIASDIK